MSNIWLAPDDDIGSEKRLEMYRIQVEIRDCEKRLRGGGTFSAKKGDYGPGRPSYSLLESRARLGEIT
jgi:hypothetical protein